ncbi:hypothetical protein GII36_01010 [Candidatus Mycosynbacter amalyticus]|uniref:PpiC domain-containing protein n=1 Tax=Candidatus Mycosynbacter amalyticus TaxID=2665156 RepID=A0A857MMD7_9BACT|nr:SurA N-terminal domain-containing protein [Candidatus Mycosynbacter amalyticus]QHN42439.1 hypothetical protein GII36_01010 [Candidatus Mycosynbacter amalyticus]
MKKLTSKLKRSKQSEKPSRITNETVAEHRERILAGGRRFKYPVQYTKHRLVWTAIAIGTVVLVLFLAVSWWQLYKSQTTDSFYYRITRVVPLPVAQVDGESVKYGDYLLNYKMSETYLDTAEKASEAQYAGGAGSKSVYDYYKAQAMQNAVIDTYAQKLAKENGITVTDQQVNDAIRALIQTSSGQSEISQEVINRSVEQLYGLSPSENRYYLRESLLRQAVAYKVDNTAKSTTDDIKAILDKDPGKSFDEIAANYRGSPTGVQTLTSGWVKKDNKDGGLAAAAAKLQKGEMAGPIKPLSGDGYYFVRLLEANNQEEINYQLIKVPLKEFKQQIDNLKQSGKVTYYIAVPDAKPQIQTK